MARRLGARASHALHRHACLFDILWKERAAAAGFGNFNERIFGLQAPGLTQKADCVYRNVRSFGGVNCFSKSVLAGIVDSIGNQKDSPLGMLRVFHMIERQDQRIVDRRLSERAGARKTFFEVGNA